MNIQAPPIPIKNNIYKRQRNNPNRNLPFWNRQFNVFPHDIIPYFLICDSTFFAKY